MVFVLSMLAVALIVVGAFFSSLVADRRGSVVIRWGGDAAMWAGIVLAVLVIGYMFGRGLAD